MITASFLVKDLAIDWRWGEKFFMQHLIDGDPAANNGGWQWVAGTGTDAAPYFRVFNPILKAASSSIGYQSYPEYQRSISIPHGRCQRRSRSNQDVSLVGIIRSLLLSTVLPGIAS
jgi:hypothetical protein